MASLALLAPFGGAVAALAEEHGAEGASSPASLLLPIINFSLFLYVFARYVWPVIKNALADRRQLIETELAEAERAIAEAQSVLRDVEARRARLRDEGQRLIADLRSEGDRERESLVAAARKSAERIRSDARVLGDQEATWAAQKIREEIALRVIERVTAELTERLRGADQERFVTEFLAGVQSEGVR